MNLCFYSMRMYFPLLFTCLVFSASSLLAQEVQTYTNKKNQYSLELPASWQLQQSPSQRIDMQALSPPEPADKVRENVNTVAYPTPAPSLDEFYAAAKAYLAQNTDGWELLKEGELETQGGERVLYLIETHTNQQNRQKMQHIAYFYFKPGLGLILTCTAIPETFEAYKERFERIATSFRWSNK
jgi:hypothetical protein